MKLKKRYYHKSWAREATEKRRGRQKRMVWFFIATLVVWTLSTLLVVEMASAATPLCGRQVRVVALGTAEELTQILPPLRRQVEWWRGHVGDALNEEVTVVEIGKSGLFESKEKEAVVVVGSGSAKNGKAIAEVTRLMQVMDDGSHCTRAAAMSLTDIWWAYSPRGRESVLRHEMGHVMGLRHGSGLMEPGFENAGYYAELSGEHAKKIRGWYGKDGQWEKESRTYEHQEKGKTEKRKSTNVDNGRKRTVRM